MATQKLLKADVISAEAVANWIFSDVMSGECMKSYVWEILHETISRKKRLIKLQESELSSEKVKLAQCLSGDPVDVDTNGSDETPSEEKIERMEERLENSVAGLKNLILFVLNKCVSLITSHISTMESDGKNFKDYWFRWAVYRLQSVLFEVTLCPCINRVH